MRTVPIFFLALAARTIAAEVDSSILERIVESTVNLRTHSIFPPYVDQDLQNRWFSFGADAYVNTNKHIRLTRDVPSQTGWLWSRLPITVQNFQVEVEFKISGNHPNIHGDGMAIWLTRRRAEPGPVFGFEDKFEGLGLFIDTSVSWLSKLGTDELSPTLFHRFPNERHSYSFPRVMAMIGDGKTPYDQARDGEPTSAGACSANMRGQDIATKIRITYIKGHFLDVKVHYRGWDQWEHCFTLEDPKLPNAPFLGLSALTGEVSDAHDIIAVTTSTLLLNHEKAGVTPLQQPQARQKGVFSKLWSLFTRLALLALVVAGGFAGWKAYLKRTGGAMPWDGKRF
ncbi:hypothetical protein BS47DRAFT_1487814 [Hydnum rufescens UP504]|uniref:L-type lectin-like domain-containing protein n=1 Tax=Hydnum rufescens UP504 TaxID=1448309 RepID=A0A9P6DQ85_9AGAM|nr:hypothetical protein BS47DRAFT_1487814 [Hydnum rufescens UP504]